MQYTVSRAEKGKIEIKVDVPKASFGEAYGQVLAAFKKETNIAGFRLGMAPDDVVENHVGLSKILNKTASSLISRYLSEIFKKENLVPLDSPKVGIDSLSAASPFSFTVSFVNKPQVKVGDWRKIKIAKVKAKEITEKDVTESIKNIFEAWRKRATTEGTEKKTEDTEIATIENTATTEDTEEESEDTENKNKKFIYGARGEKIFINQDKSIKDKSDESKSKVESQDKVDDNFARAIGARDLEYLREL